MVPTIVRGSHELFRAAGMVNPRVSSREYPARRRSRTRHEHALVRSLGKKVIAVLAIIVVTLLAIFWGVEDTESTEILVQQWGTRSSSQSVSAATYVESLSTRQWEDGTATTVDLSAAYVDAAGKVAAYNRDLVHDSGGIVTGANAPTRELTDCAYVVNLSVLLEQEFSDIIALERAQGVTGHKDATEYVLEKLKFENTFHRERSMSRATLGGAVGPAITMRDFYSAQRYFKNCTQADHFYGCWDSAESRYIDLMLVENSNVQKYLQGGDVSVIYLQYEVSDAKAHTAPWGLTQTYIHFKYVNREPCMNLSNDSSGSSMRDLSVPITEDAVEGLGNLQAARGEAYWWPYLEGAGSMQVATKETASVVSSTGNIFECYCKGFDTSQLDAYAGEYSVVGVLVYAEKE